MAETSPTPSKKKKKKEQVGKSFLVMFKELHSKGWAKERDRGLGFKGEEENSLEGKKRKVCPAMPTSLPGAVVSGN